MNMLSRLLGKKDADIRQIIAGVDAAAAPRGLRRRFEKIRSKKQGGFTLLELLVVVAILAAIAGTATVLFHDTDKKAFAAAHVGMMDQLSKGILNFYQLNGSQYPDEWDSLVAENSLAAAVTPIGLMNSALSGQLGDHLLTTAQFTALSDSGIKKLRVIDATATQVVGGVATACTAANLKTIINSKDNDVNVQNIYRLPANNGCGGASVAIADTNHLLKWTGGNGRVNAADGDVLLAFGVGPDATLFQPTKYGALTNTPIYRHVAQDEYNRFVALFNLTGVNGKATFQAIVDGAGDTKDEELGEFDNTRPT